MTTKSDVHMVAEFVQNTINQQLFDKLQLAYFCVDQDRVIQETSDNLCDYGFVGTCTGQNVDDVVDFMVGIDVNTELDLPMVASPAGIPISVSLLPSNGQLTVLIANASVAAEQRQMLQQAANENELLVDQQQKLMAELEHASQELAQKNQQLEEASRLQTSFLSGVSHEFRTPLSSIIGYTNLVRRDLDKLRSDAVSRIPTAPDSASYLNAVQRSSKHLLSLVENLLDHGKLDSNEIVVRPKKTDLHEVFADVAVLLAPLCATKNITFDVNLNLPAQAHSMMDDSRLRQCLINLVGNAIKFTDVGSVTLDASLNGEQLDIVVIDTGLGISQEDLQKIRLPFYQAADTGKVGTGLGLTITERIIELMGGELEIQSEEGKGTQVSFSISAPLVDPVQNPQVAASSPRKLSILLAEDDSDIADLVLLMLTERGVTVTHVENGALAVAALQQQAFDLVLMDIHMPIMTGYEAIAEANKLGNKVPIVVMSASSIEADQARAVELGCAAYLVKPVDVDEILSIADIVLEHST